MLCADNLLATVLQGVDVKYTSIRFNSTFTKETIYRQKPSPEVDAAWMALGTDCKFLSSRGPNIENYAEN